MKQHQPICPSCSLPMIAKRQEQSRLQQRDKVYECRECRVSYVTNEEAKAA
jgi:predicted RNA-binding Zn-ribbon protein involved in translation (DUF1610 family)